MKNYLKISLVLGLICLVCSLILAGMNLLTEGKIAENNKQAKLSTINTIYSDYEDISFESQTRDDLIAKGYEVDSKVEERNIIKSNGNVIGYVYQVSGKNAYGNITLMVAVSLENTLYQVEFLDNGQSFASTVASWVKSNFKNNGATVYEAGFVSEKAQGTNGQSVDEVSSVDVSCGATYGATLVRELITSALTCESEVE